MKRLFRYCFFSIFLILFGCAPRPMPPPTYSGMDLTLKEVITEASDGIETAKVVVDIDVERDNTPYHHSSASVLIKRPGMVHMKMYNLGMLTDDVVVKEGEVYVLHGRINRRLKAFIRELYDTVFWWDDAEEGSMYKDNDMYIIRTDKRELYIDSATLLPVRQYLNMGEEMLYITYDMPAKEGDFWYPSSMEIRMDEYRFSVKIKRLVINPQLGVNDFRIF